MRDDTREVIAGFVRRANEQGIAFDDDMISRLEMAYTEFITSLMSAYKDNSGSRPTTVHIVDSRIVNEERNKKIQAFLDTHDGEYAIVTMDPLCDFPGTIPFAVSRLFDPLGLESVQLTNRPGHDTISHQIHAIQQAAHGRQVILVEDDLFSGSTIQRTMELLRGEGMNGSDGTHVEVAALFPGIQALSQDPLTIKGNLFIDPVFTVDIPFGHNTEDVLDIGDPRDFLVGGDGLVTSVGRMPYIRPFVSPSARASVPEHCENSFSSTVLDLTQRFYRQAEMITGQTWPASFCEPAAQDGLVHHGLVEHVERITKSMTHILDDVFGLHKRVWSNAAQQKGLA